MTFPQDTHQMLLGCWCFLLTFWRPLHPQIELEAQMIPRRRLDSADRPRTTATPRTKGAKTMKCSHPLCNEPERYYCDGCNKPFCEDHGSRGGDQQVQDVGAVAYPSMCWACGGYNADEGAEIPA